MIFYTKKEVADYLRVHPRTVERWLILRTLKGYKLGSGKTSLWRISEESLREFLVGRSQGNKNAHIRRKKGK